MRRFTHARNTGGKPALGTVFEARRRQKQEVSMRALALIAVASATLSLSSAGVEAAPWCAQYSGGRGGGTNCGFYSFEQCQQTVRGIGGFCSLNPFEAYGYQQQRAPRRNWRRNRD
jgi:hypothetical protein